MQKNTDEKGMSVPLVIIGLCLVVVLGIAGWLIYQKSQDDSKSDKTSQETPKNSQPNSPTKPTDPSEGGKYLVIKEWNVRLVLPESLRNDIYYRTYTLASPTSEAAIFGSKELDTLVKNGSCSIEPRADGSTGPGLSTVISRIKPKITESEALTFYRSQHTQLANIGEYEYGHVLSSKNPPITCVEDASSDAANVERAKREALTTALSGIEAIK